MPMYNLFEYGGNYSMTLGSLWNYYKDEVNDYENENNNDDYRINNNNTTTSKSLKCKTKIVGSTPDSNSRLAAQVVVLLTYITNFWRSLDLPLINCEIEIDLWWLKNCIISEISRTPEINSGPHANPPVLAAPATETNNATFQIINDKLYFP